MSQQFSLRTVLSYGSYHVGTFVDTKLAEISKKIVVTFSEIEHLCRHHQSRLSNTVESSIVNRKDKEQKLEK